MMILVVLIYIAMGLFQCSAIFAGFAYTFGKFFGFILALILGEMPILGTIMGIVGACKGWGWSIGKALLIFIIPFIFNMTVGYIMSRKEK